MTQIEVKKKKSIRNNHKQLASYEYRFRVNFNKSFNLSAKNLNFVYEFENHQSIRQMCIGEHIIQNVFIEKINKYFFQTKFNSRRFIE